MLFPFLTFLLCLYCSDLIYLSLGWFETVGKTARSAPNFSAQAHVSTTRHHGTTRVFWSVSRALNTPSMKGVALPAGCLNTHFRGLRMAARLLSYAAWSRHGCCLTRTHVWCRVIETGADIEPALKNSVLSAPFFLPFQPAKLGDD
jgi:hypothetical protein